MGTEQLGWVCRTAKVRYDKESHQTLGAAQVMPSSHL